MTEIARLPMVAAQPFAQTRLRQLAEELEAGFLSEMLSHSGLGATREGFGGGSGEAQFTSFLVQEQARAMARAGGIGLAEQIFHALTRDSDAADRG